jgi:hypothetical protein
MAVRHFSSGTSDVLKVAVSADTPTTTAEELSSLSTFSDHRRLRAKIGVSSLIVCDATAHSGICLEATLHREKSSSFRGWSGESGPGAGAPSTNPKYEEVKPGKSLRLGFSIPVSDKGRSGPGFGQTLPLSLALNPGVAASAASPYIKRCYRMPR